MQTVGRKSLSGSGDSPQVRVRVSSRLREQLAETAREQGVAVSDVVRRALIGTTRQAPRSEELVQCELHRRIIPKVIADPDHVRKVARRNLEQMRSRRQSPLSAGWIAEWEHLIAGPVGPLIATLVRTDERGIDLRQMSPFAGVLDDAERCEAIATGRALAEV